jgi:hypothetical protein
MYKFLCLEIPELKKNSNFLKDFVTNILKFSATKKVEHFIYKCLKSAAKLRPAIQAVHANQTASANQIASANQTARAN